MSTVDISPQESVYIDSRRIGNATITIINDGDVTVPMAAVFHPDEVAWLRAEGLSADDELIETSQLVIHIALGEESIIIDPAFDDPGTPWDREFATRWPRVRRTPGLAAGLKAIGVDPDEVTEVIVTHAHEDHFAGVLQDVGDCLQARFPNARHLIGRADWTDNPQREQPDDALAARLGPIASLGLITAVDGEYEVAPGITILPAPGESPGHLIVRVASGGETFFALGDLFHHFGDVINPAWYSPWNDPAVILASRQQFLADVSPNDTVVYTHAAFPGWGRIVRDGEGYRWEGV